MRPREEFRSPNEEIVLRLEETGSAVIYDGSVPLWSTDTTGIIPKLLMLNTGGNLVLYDSDNKAVFQTGTGGSLCLGRCSSAREVEKLC